MAARSKRDVSSIPQAVADDLPIPERMLLFCLSSGTEWEHAGITHATAQQMVVRGLIDHVGVAGRFRITPLGHSVFQALLKPPIDEGDGRILTPKTEHTAPPLLLCPNCNYAMLVFGVEPDGPKRDLYTFECDNCGRLEVRGVPIR